ncbi:hypothetical protein [Streptomyces sp. NPDC053755]
MWTQWELLRVHQAGLMDSVDFYRWNRRREDWTKVELKKGRTSWSVETFP